MMHDGYWMDWSYGWMGLHMLIWIFVLFVFLYFVFRMVGKSDIQKSETPRDIIDRRYASGEIDKEEYERLKKDLQ